MNCPRCATPATALATEPGTYGALRRRYLCGGGHHFTTLEAWEPPAPSIERKALVNALAAIAKRFNPRKVAA